MTLPRHTDTCPANLPIPTLIPANKDECECTRRINCGAGILSLKCCCCHLCHAGSSPGANVKSTASISGGMSSVGTGALGSSTPWLEPTFPAARASNRPFYIHGHKKYGVISLCHGCSHPSRSQLMSQMGRVPCVPSVYAVFTVLAS
jgi:hypothetical protein